MDAQTTALATDVMPTVFTQGQMFLFIALMIWSMIWQGIGLRKAGTKKQLTWFICMFIFNTAGILPIIYLAFFQKKEKGKK